MENLKHWNLSNFNRVLKLFFIIWLGFTFWIRNRCWSSKIPKNLSLTTFVYTCTCILKNKYSRPIGGDVYPRNKQLYSDENLCNRYKDYTHTLSIHSPFFNAKIVAFATASDIRCAAHGIGTDKFVKYVQIVS